MKDLRYIIIEDVFETQRPAARFKTEVYFDANPVVCLQFRQGFWKLKWWRTYFESEAVHPETVGEVKARLVKNAVDLGL